MYKETSKTPNKKGTDMFGNKNYTSGKPPKDLTDCDRYKGSGKKGKS